MAKSAVFSGIIWATIQRFGTMIIAFVTNIILSRLLTPDDFGVVGMLLLFIAISNTFVDSGLGSALIQKTSPSKTDYSTVFYINLILSVFFYLILFFSAPVIAHFYKTEILIDLLRVEGTVVILNAFCIIQTTILRKNLDFKNLSIATLLSNIIGTIISIVMAYNGFGLWSLAFRQIIVSFLGAGLLWYIGKWKPSVCFSWRSFKELFNFGGFMLLSSIVSTISNNIQTLIIGRMFNQSTLGNYTQARQLRDIPATSISSVINQVLFPDFSNQKEDKSIKSKLEFSVKVIVYFCSAIMALCILGAEPIITILYSSKWLGAVDYFKVMCIGGVFISVQGINYNLIAAMGKSKFLFTWDFIQVAISIILMLIFGYFWGMMGLLLTMVISAFLFYLVYAITASKILGGTPWIQFRGVGNSIIQATACYLGSVLLLSFLPSIENNWLSLGIRSSIFILLFLTTSLLCKSEVLLYFINNHLKKR